MESSSDNPQQAEEDQQEGDSSLTSKNVFAEHYHKVYDCPPAGRAKPENMTVYRIVQNKNSSMKGDYKSHYERDPSRFATCKNRAISVFSSAEEAAESCRFWNQKFYKRKRIAKGQLTPEHGVFEQEDSICGRKALKSHHNFWAHEGVEVHAEFVPGSMVTDYLNE